MNYPSTYKEFPENPSVRYPQVFDPALKQFPRAFRHGEPSFRDPDMAVRWREARRLVLDSILRAVAQSAWSENLILRGSRLLKEWFGDAAREPGDLDWVIQPASIKIDDSTAANLCDDLMQTANAATSRPGAVCIIDVRIEDIWTYDRVPGRRLVYYWRTDNIPPGSAQVDLIFGEEMWVAPYQASIALSSGHHVPLWAATQELSLAWKLQWLDSDSYTQGKDLYRDAVLLAETTPIRSELIALALPDRIRRSGRQPLTPDFPLQWWVDWETFQREYPWVNGSASDWQNRLVKALTSSFARPANEGQGW